MRLEGGSACILHVDEDGMAKCVLTLNTYLRKACVRKAYVRKAYVRKACVPT